MNLPINFILDKKCCCLKISSFYRMTKLIAMIKCRKKLNKNVILILAINSYVIFKIKIIGKVETFCLPMAVESFLSCVWVFMPECVLFFYSHMLLIDVYVNFGVKPSVHMIIEVSFNRLVCWLMSTANISYAVR